ncbi:uncharacterized protein LOC112212743 [Bombus impatiens]|uniref:Uncharacterized protein LOC112212743 n=1 Tax=Bombus impatiens TaxID=132113 RepID=A0A6P6F9Y3_BOMIM|nr:uncharacterized protein LOC112212743 [Bombus impatiens]
MLLEIEIGGGAELQKKNEKKEEEEGKEKREWTNKSMEKYLDECKDWTCNGRTVAEMWTEINKKINEAMPKKKVKIRSGKREKESKREMRRKVTKFMKGKYSREALMEEKRHSNRGANKERKDTKKKKW